MAVPNPYATTALLTTNYNVEYKGMQNGVPNRVHYYRSNHTKAEIVTAEYFSLLGSTNGNGTLTVGDWFFIIADEDGTDDDVVCRVTDAALGTVAAATLT